MIWLFSGCTQAHALTVGEIGGDYTTEYFAFNGSVAPQTQQFKISLKSTGIFSVMCKETIGDTTYEYPCYSDVWHIDANNLVIVAGGVVCNTLNTDTLFCYIKNSAAGLVMLRNTAYTLNITKAGTGSGTVTSTTGLSCGSVCSQSLTPNKVVNLVAAPDNGSLFSGWSGCDNISGNTCTMLMTADKTTTATFTKQSFLLTVNNANTSGGTVISSVGSINCGSTCSDSYNYGQKVMLTAYPAAGYKINNSYDWTCDAVSNICYENIAIYNNNSINVDWKLIQ